MAADLAIGPAGLVHHDVRIARRRTGLRDPVPSLPFVADAFVPSPFGAAHTRTVSPPPER
ncbi:hypothetical protein [Streptomyces alanosinicus]|uniref:Uncharacterized protein n=1 Tax=Streptomyces alanosinicus TaxID=68171 RepID=A0A918YPC4_9ACTN|nr:hypothetical protein [Streptomyces alanosinicus]GHE10643.1 hypothetical protein GCM10010339_67530 [Streptomyces alanosinicus]